MKQKRVRNDNMDFYIYFRYDFVYVYDGGISFGTEIAVLTGTFNDTVTSTATELFVYFLSDDTVTAAGFRIQFDAIIG